MLTPGAEAKKDATSRTPGIGDTAVKPGNVGETTSGEVKAFGGTDGLLASNFAGPLDINGDTNLDICDNWDRFWQTGSDDINGFISDWNDGTLDNAIPESLLAWPAKGNPHFSNQNGFESVSHYLAPFVDTNQDGIYDPEDGDYPVIKGADQAFFYVFSMVETGVPSNEAYKVEVHTTCYAYTSNDPVIDVSTFYDFQILNRSSFDLRNTYMAISIDPSLGCPTDDYFGCDTLNQMAFIYNEDDTDGQTGCSCSGGTTTFCNSIPMVGIKILKGTTAGRLIEPDGSLSVPGPGVFDVDTFINTGLSRFSYFNDGGVQPSPDPGTIDPNTSVEFYNYMNGKWIDGMPITIGGNGYDDNSTDYTNYAFHGDPSNGEEWSMCSENLNTIDRKMMLSSGPFHLQPSQYNSMSMAIFHVAPVPHPCPSLDLLREGANTITDLFDSFPTTTKEVARVISNIRVAPNPFSNQTQLSLENDQLAIQNIELYNTSGQLMKSIKGLNRKSIVIKRNQLPTGLYFYKINTTNQQIISGKLMIQ
ncbi:MAG: T9SS type A sorting domain-containing protein [Saprospiraceae bacterium]